MSDLNILELDYIRKEKKFRVKNSRMSDLNILQLDQIRKEMKFRVRNSRMSDLNILQLDQIRLDETRNDFLDLILQQKTNIAPYVCDKDKYGTRHRKWVPR